MNARETLTLDSVGQATKGEQANRLEIFEENMRLNDEVADLKAQLQQAKRDHVDEISTLRHQQGDPVQTAIDMLRDYGSMQTQIDQLHATIAEKEEQLKSLNGNTQEQAQLIDKLKAEVVQATRLSDHYQQECEKLLAKHNGEVDKANVTITKLHGRISAFEKELKELKALNPKKLHKQVKNLQERNRELNNANERLKKEAKAGKDAIRQNEELKAANKRLYADNLRLDGALESACEDINHGNTAVKPLEDLPNDWAIYGDTATSKRLIIVDKTNDNARPIHCETGLYKARAVPAAVIKAAEKIFEKIETVKDQMGDYSQPLEEQEFANV